MCVPDSRFGRDERVFSAVTGPSAGRLCPVHSLVTAPTELYRRLYHFGTKLQALKPKITTPGRVPPLALILVNLNGS
jgi:hypothetical protein